MNKMNTGNSKKHITNSIHITGTEATYCPICYKVCEEVITKVPVEDNSTIFESYGKVILKYCNKCKKYFLSQERAEKIQHNVPKYRYRSISLLKKKDTKINISKQKQEPESVHKYTDEEIKYVIVYKYHCHCISCERSHHFPLMENYSLYVNNREGDTVMVPVFRCSVCGRYYVGDEVLKSREKLYGKLLFERRTEESEFGLENKGCDREYAEDTILSRCGYSTKIENPRTRWDILTFILNTGKATKSQVCEILSCFIHQRKNCHTAIPRWERDLEYISGYEVEKHPKIYKFEFVKKQ